MVDLNLLRYCALQDLFIMLTKIAYILQFPRYLFWLYYFVGSYFSIWIINPHSISMVHLKLLCLKPYMLGRKRRRRKRKEMRKEKELLGPRERKMVLYNMRRHGWQLPLHPLQVFFFFFSKCLEHFFSNPSIVGFQRSSRSGIYGVWLSYYLCLDQVGILEVSYIKFRIGEACSGWSRFSCSWYITVTWLPKTLLL